MDQQHCCLPHAAWAHALQENSTTSRITAHYKVAYTVSAKFLCYAIIYKQISTDIAKRAASLANQQLYNICNCVITYNIVLANE